MPDSVTGPPPTPAKTPPRVLTGERTLMRIIISADARHEGRATSQAVVELLRARGFAGATAIPGIMGFGARHSIHSQLNEITSIDLPVVIEAVEEQAQIAAVLPEIDAMITGGVITLERAAVRLYRGRPQDLATPPSPA